MPQKNDETLCEDYIKGYNDGVKDLAEKLKTFYRIFRSHTYSASVAYHIEQIEKETKLKEDDCCD